MGTHDRACAPSTMAPLATGGAAPKDTKEAAAKSAKKPAKRQAFNSTLQRKMHVDYLGEGTPGPGSYMPASTFGAHAKAVAKSTKAEAKRPSSSFRSGSPQRAGNLMQSVPGAGAYSPNSKSIEKNANNPSAGMKSKSKRFGGMSGPLESADAKREPGPGEYESQNHKTIQTYVAKRRERMSRQNPGFGASTPAHTLPYEQDLVNDQKPFQNFSEGHDSSPTTGGYGSMPSHSKHGSPDLSA